MKDELQMDDSTDLSAIIGVLLDSLDDKSEDVKHTVTESIRKISVRHANVVIHATVYYIELHPKMSNEHMNILLNIMTSTCKNIVHLDADLASSVAGIAVNKLENNTDNQASELLVALSKTHCTQAMGELLSKLEPGILPNSVIVYTIGKIAADSPCEMLSFFKILLTIMLPMLNQTKDDALKKSFCFTLRKLSEAINDYMISKRENSEISKQTYKEEIHHAFDIIVYEWAKLSRDHQLIEAALTACVPMILILPPETHGDRLTKLIPIVMNLCKKANTRLPAIRVLATLLNNSSIDHKEILRPFLESIYHGLFELVSACPFEVPRQELLIHYETLQCSRVLVVLYPDEGLDRILNWLKSSIAVQRAKALVLLRHLINTLPPEDDENLQRIALTLQESLGESCARQMVGAIVALAARPTVPLLPSQRATFVRYIVLHCGLKHNETDACTDALHLLATTVDGIESWLWPCLIRTLLDSTFSASTTSILKALSPLVTKIFRSDDNSILEKDFPTTKVLSRCLELLSESKNRLASLTFLKHASPLFGHQTSSYWNEKLSEIINFLQEQNHDNNDFRNEIWQNAIVEMLEESIKLEGETWGSKLANELASKTNIKIVALFLASVCTDITHVSLLVHLAHSNGSDVEYAQSVGICAKRHLNAVLNLMTDLCLAEDARKMPVKLLGFVIDTKAAATAEAAKAGLLRSYAEIVRRINVKDILMPIEKSILPWIIKQISDCKELTTKEAGLYALEQVTTSLHPERLPEFSELKNKSSFLAVLLALLQSSSGYKPLQLYVPILKAGIGLIRLPPALTPDERHVLLSTLLDKVLAASSEIASIQKPETLQQVTIELGIICCEIITDSADALAEFVDILLPWMQSKSNIERKTTLLVLRTVLRSYYKLLKYTYSSGLLEPGRLLGRVISWCVDSDIRLRPIVIDCVEFSLNISLRHRSKTPDFDMDQVFSEIKQMVVNDDPKILFQGVKVLSSNVSQRISPGEVISLAEGLIEGLLYRGEAGLAAGVALSQHFEIKGSEISNTDIFLVDSIISQMRQIENFSCRRGAAEAIKSLTIHHAEIVIDHLLSQPLPLDTSCEDCWRELGASDKVGSRVMEILLMKLENNNIFSESAVPITSSKNNTASLPSLTAIIALKHLIAMASFEVYVEKQLAPLLSIILKYLSGWLHADAPTSIISTKFGYVPSKDSCKINPFKEVYCVFVMILTSMDPTVEYSLLNGGTFCQEVQNEDNLISTIRILMKCLATKNDVLSSLAQSLEKLFTSTNIAQRAVAATFYGELVGKVDCGDIWLDTILNVLHDCKSDSSPLVRKLAIMGLAGIAYLDLKQVDEYFDNTMTALLEGLEEPFNNEGKNDVVLESLRGLTMLLSVPIKKTISPRIVLALKPFIQKDNWELRLAAISTLNAIANNWHKSIETPDDDITDHLLGCIPGLTMRLIDSNSSVATIARETLCNISGLLQCDTLHEILNSMLSVQAEFNFNNFVEKLIECLKQNLPQRADELRHSILRGYSRSENANTRAASALILGLFGKPSPEEIQRLLQLLRDTDSIVRTQAAESLSLCFSE